MSNEFPRRKSPVRSLKNRPHALVAILGTLIIATANSEIQAADFDARALDVWVTPADACIGDAVSVTGRFRNLSDPNGPYGGTAQFDARIIIISPSGSSSFRFVNNWEFSFSGQELSGQFWSSYTLSQAGTYTITAEIYDNSGYESGWSPSHRFDAYLENFTVTNSAPTASRDNPINANITLYIGQNFTFRVRGQDCDSNLNVVEWYRASDDPDDPVAINVMGGSDDIDSWTTSFSNPGVYGITAIVYDDEWLDDQVSWNVTVENRAPNASRLDPPDASVTVTRANYHTFDALVTDADGDLDYVEWYRDGVYTGDRDEVAGHVSTASHTAEFPLIPLTGSIGITAGVYDQDGQYNEISWDVEVVEPQRGMYIDYLGYVTSNTAELLSNFVDEPNQAASFSIFSPSMN